MKYGTLNLQKLELENADTANIVQSLVNDKARNRSERRKIMKSLGKYENRDKYFERQMAKETDEMRDKFQNQLDKRIDEAKDVVNKGLIDNWEKSVALSALVLKRIYNWSNNRVSNFIIKSNELHLAMRDNGEWDNIVQILSDECDINIIDERRKEET